MNSDTITIFNVISIIGIIVCVAQYSIIVENNVFKPIMNKQFDWRRSGLDVLLIPFILALMAICIALIGQMGIGTLKIRPDVMFVFNSILWACHATWLTLKNNKRYNNANTKTSGS